MAGKMCFGSVLNNSYRIKETRSFSEGIYFRSSGTAAAFPISGNPHDSGSSAAIAWDNGWNVAQAAVGVTIAQSAAPCVAVPTNVISA